MLFVRFKMSLLRGYPSSQKFKSLVGWLSIFLLDSCGIHSHVIDYGNVPNRVVMVDQTHCKHPTKSIETPCSKSPTRLLQLLEIRKPTHMTSHYNARGLRSAASPTWSKCFIMGHQRFFHGSNKPSAGLFNGGWHIRTNNNEVITILNTLRTPIYTNTLWLVNESASHCMVLSPATAGGIPTPHWLVT